MICGQGQWERDFSHSLCTQSTYFHRLICWSVDNYRGRDILIRVDGGRGGGGKGGNSR